MEPEVGENLDIQNYLSLCISNGDIAVVLWNASTHILQYCPDNSLEVEDMRLKQIILRAKPTALLATKATFDALKSVVCIENTPEVYKEIVPENYYSNAFFTNRNRLERKNF
uniref:Uncharacterized protein n=1 Tax=Trichobilharzia regenti TaxID=157069 RepID=A0AA85JHV5_TRIRE|nr:unnamed protein product [Trichobilharzia regenti]